jgi:iron complex outermembrane receptor protein
VSRVLALTLGARRSSVEDRNHIASSDHKDELDARELGLNYQLSPGTRLFARYAEGFRFANADENGSVLPSVDFLRAQTSESSEVGMAWQGNNTQATITFYDMSLVDEITYDPLIVNAGSWNGMGANINLPKSQRRGLIVDSDWQVSEQVNLRANYTYTDAELTSGTFAGNAVPFVAENTASIAVIYAPTAQWSTYVDSTYTGSRYRAGDNTNEREKTSAVTLFNANVLWTEDELELSFRVKNIADKRYSDYQGLVSQYPQPGRTYEAGISYRF